MREAYLDEGDGQTKPIVKNTLHGNHYTEASRGACNLGMQTGGLAMSMGEQADGKSKRGNGYHQFIKRRKRKAERKKARIDPEVIPAYKKFNGWET